MRVPVGAKRPGKGAGKTTRLERGEVPPPKSVVKRPSVIPLPPGWRQAGEVFEKISSVASCLLDFDRAVKVGGLPLGRIITVHGETAGGKTAMVWALIRSFVDAGHYAKYIDAEHAIDEKFATEILGRPLKSVPNLGGSRPANYEETIDDVDVFLKWMAARVEQQIKEDGRSDLACIIVVDSINKLTPKRELEKLTRGAGKKAGESGGDAIDKGWGRLRAAFNQAWLDHLIPLLHAARCALVVIAQEREGADANHWDPPNVKGGKSLLYDASLIARVMKAKPMRDGEGKDAPTYGFQHRIRIWKSKVGHMSGRWVDSYFHLSNGLFVPPGLDLARDALTVGRDLDVVKVAGSWLSWNRRRWQGEHRAVQALAADVNTLHELVADVRKAIDTEAGR